MTDQDLAPYTKAIITSAMMAMRELHRGNIASAGSRLEHVLACARTIELMIEHERRDEEEVEK